MWCGCESCYDFLMPLNDRFFVFIFGFHFSAHIFDSLIIIIICVDICLFTIFFFAIRRKMNRILETRTEHETMYLTSTMIRMTIDNGIKRKLFYVCFVSTKLNIKSSAS